tara:strand:+ start:135 stop:1994 length:1860 start_codon:yes stop_codon:yes gene_type:complete
MTTLTQVPFARLVATDAINARAATKEGLDELAASIEVKGLIQPLCVRLADTGTARGGDQYEIIDGRRRYQALARLVKDKVLKRDHPVPVIVRNEDDGEALETSLMANTVRLPMHPVDQYEVMARLAEQGLTTAEIAARFGLAQRTVQQQLALGRLAPEVRAAWKKGRFDAKIAQAFAAHADHGVQAAVLAKCGKHVQEWQVRHELSGKRARLDQSDELALIGEAAYLAAGGKIEDDLFEEARYVADVPLAKKLARDKLQAECNKLIKDGWAWAEVEESCGGTIDILDCSHVWDKPDGSSIDVSDDPKDYSKAERKKSGCLIGFGPEPQTVLVSYGLIKPEHRHPNQTDLEDFTDDDDPGELPSARAMVDAAPVAAEQPDNPFAISQALTVTIHEALTVAAAQVLKAEPLAALQVLVAQLECSSSNGPVKVTDGGNAVVSDRHKRDHSKRFSHRLKQVRGAGVDALLLTLAGRVAQALSMVPSGVGVYNATTEIGEVVALRDFLDDEAYLAAIRSTFDAADYFARARKETAIAALEDMHDAGHHFGLQGRSDLEGMKKAELAEWAAEQAKACGWLPPELRHPAYSVAASEKLTGKMAAAEQSADAETVSVPASAKRKAKR